MTGPGFNRKRPISITFKLEVTIQGSNDLQNWSNVSSTAVQIGVGFNASLKQGSIAFRFVRLRLQSFGTIHILAAGMIAVAA